MQAVWPTKSGECEIFGNPDAQTALASVVELASTSWQGSWSQSQIDNCTLAVLDILISRRQCFYVSDGEVRNTYNNRLDTHSFERIHPVPCIRVPHACLPSTWYICLSHPVSSRYLAFSICTISTMSPRFP
jgi:hypothetical protein